MVLSRDRRIGTYRRSCTSLPHTPASITAWVLSNVPAEREKSTQHASVRISASLDKSKRSRAGNAGLTCP